MARLTVRKRSTNQPRTPKIPPCPPHVSAIWAELATDDGWWATYKPGWKSASDPVGALHGDHESTKAALMKAIRLAIPCTCPDCVPKVK